MRTQDQKGADPVAPQQRHQHDSWFSQLTPPVVNTGRALAAAAALMGAGAPKLEGGIYADGTDGALQLELGTRLSGPITPEGGGTVTVKISFTDTNSPTGRSARYFSGAIYNRRTVLSAAHGFLGYEGLAAEIRTGPNFRTNPGTIHKVKEIKLNPDFIRLGRGGTFDLAVLTTEEPIDTLDAKISTNRPAVGSTVTLSGVGMTGTPSTGFTAKQDGSVRAGTSAVAGDLTTSASGQSTEFYVATSFGNNPSKPGEIRGASGDSGGPVFVLDQQGKVVSLAGLMVSVPPLIQLGITYFLDLSQPTVRKFIDDNAWTPEPQLPNLAILPSNGGLWISWAETPNVVLQQGPSPHGPWTTCTNTPTTQNGTSAVFLYSGNLDSMGFFRLTGSP